MEDLDNLDALSLEEKQDDNKPVGALSQAEKDALNKQFSSTSSTFSKPFGALSEAELEAKGM
jgi:hypothetical protein